MSKPEVSKEEMLDWIENSFMLNEGILPQQEREIKDALRRLIKEHGQYKKAVEDRPIIVCLCGSTRFMDAFFDAGWAETLAGKIVLSVGVCKHAENHGGEALGPEIVHLLDELHLRKIDVADEVLILNVSGYIGESTRNELEYAKKKGKRIRFLEQIKESRDEQT